MHPDKSNALAVGVSAQTAKLITESRAANTLRAYRSALTHLDRWLGKRALTDALFADYIGVIERRGLSAGSAVTAVSAAKWRAKNADQSNPAGNRTDAAIKGFRRKRADGKRGPARTITHDEIMRVLAAAETAERWRDVAMVKLLYFGCLRRSEVAALRWSDLTLHPDFPDAHIVTVRKSKANQDGERIDRRLVKGLGEALDAIRPDDMDEAENRTIFQRSGHTIYRRFVASCRLAGVPHHLTPHSCRRGFAAEAIKRGASTAEVAKSGGWDNDAMVVRYASGTALQFGTVAKYF